MSRCLICDVFIEQPKISPIDLKSEPCGACQRVIQETLESYNDELEEGEDCYAYIEEDSRYDDRKYLLASIKFDGHIDLPVGEKYVKEEFE